MQRPVPQLLHPMEGFPARLLSRGRGVMFMVNAWREASGQTDTFVESLRGVSMWSICLISL
jgi:hypothetical protein